MSPDVPAERWRLSTRFAFRFAVIYFTLYVLTTQMLGALAGLPNADIPTPPPIRALITWVAAHVFRVSQPLVIIDSGSGDKIFDWVQVFCLLVIASVGTTLWSILDRRRPHYVRLQQWFRLGARFALGSTLMLYGMVKVFPLQMSFPNLTRLVEPYGNFSPMGVLWASIGASPSYELFVGSAELIGGILICLPGLATLGALICLIDTIQVFTLNMTYDVPVKLFSFQLLVLSLVILGPELSRLTNVILLNRAAGPSRLQPLGHTPRTRRIVYGVQTAFAIYLVGMNLFAAGTSRKQYGDLAPTTPLKGIWAIDVMMVDSESRPPQGRSADRWRRVIIQYPTSLVVQRMDDSFQYYRLQIDMEASTLAVTRAGPGQTPQPLKFSQPTPTTLRLDGTLDGHVTHIETTLLDHRQFLLVTRGFHWIQEYPFNR